MFGVTIRYYRETGTARTIDSLGQGSGVYVLLEHASIADNAGLTLKILLVPLIVPPMGDLDGPKGHTTQLGAQPPSCWILKSLPL